MSGFRRFLSLFLVLAMCVSLLPVSALAEEEAAVEVVSVEELTELVEPEVTEEPAETAEPETTAAPEETAAPEVTEEPAATEAPVETEEPEETEIPAEIVEPEETETPAVEAEQESETLLATSGTCGDNLTWSLSDDGVLTFSGTGDMWEYDNVTLLPWYEYRDNISSVVIGAGVTSLYEYAVSDLYGVKEFVVSSGNTVFTSSEDGVLFTKDGKTLLCYPSGKQDVFSYTVPDGVTVIAGGAFFLTCLEEVSLPKGLLTIEGWAFNAAFFLMDITIPSTVTTIGPCAFQDCDSLTEVDIPAGVQELYSSSFNSSEQLESINVSANNPYYTSVDGVLFSKDMTILMSVPLANTDEYEIPYGVEYIAESAFNGNQIHTLTIPVTVTAIHPFALGFLGLTDVYYGGTQAQWNAISIGSSNEYLTNATIHYNYSSPLKIVPGENAWAFSNSPSSFGKRREGYEMTDSDFMRLLQNLDETDKELIYYRVYKENGKFLEWIYSIFNINEKKIKWKGSCYGMSTWVCLAEAGVVDAADIADKSPLGEYECTDIVESAINYYHMQQYIALKDDRVTEFKKKSQQEQLEILKSLAINASETGIPVLVLYQWYKSFDKKGNCETGSYAGHAVVAYGVEEGDFTDYVYGRMELKDRQDAIKDEYEFTKRILVYDCSRLGSQTSEASHIYYTEDGVVCIPAVGFISTDSQTADTKYNNGILELATIDSSYLDMVNYNTGETSDYYKHETDASSNALYTSNSDHSLAWGDDTAEVSGFTVSSSNSDENISVVVFADATEEDDEEPATKMIMLPEAESYTMGTEEEIDFQLHCGDSLMRAAADASGTVELETDGGVHVKLETAADYDIGITANDGCADMTWSTIQLLGEDAMDVSAFIGEEGVVISGDNLSGVRVIGRTDGEMADLYFTTEESSVLVSEDDSVLVIREDADKDGVYEKEIMSSDIVGDVNGSGVINCMDLVSLMKYLVGMTEDVAVNKCDMNGDDNINIQDAVCLVKTLATEN